MPVSQNEYLWSGATPILLISPARFFVYKGAKIDYFLYTPLDYRLLFVLVLAVSQPIVQYSVAQIDRLIMYRAGTESGPGGSIVQSLYSVVRVQLYKGFQSAQAPTGRSGLVQFLQFGRSAVFAGLSGRPQTSQADSCAGHRSLFLYPGT